VSAPTLSRTPASPAATRSTRRGWRDPRLAVGVGLVALCALLGARLLGNAADTVAVWSVERDTVVGQALTADDLEPVRIHFERSADADRYLSADDELPAGSVLTRDVGAGEMLPRSAVGEEGVVDLVELPLTVPTHAVPATVRIGAAVDVWVTPTDPATTKGRATLVLEGVPVLALPTGGDSISPSADRQIIVGLGPDEQGALSGSLASLASGTVVVTRRAGR
jgi:hypothetical protein